MKILFEIIKPYLQSETIIDIFFSLIIFLSFLLFRKIFSKYIYKSFQSLTSKTKTDLDDKILQAVKKPLEGLLLVIGFYVALIYLELPLSVDIFVLKILRSAIIITLAWGLYNLEATGSVLFIRLEKIINIEIDRILIPFFSKTLRFVTVVITLGIILQEWGYDVNGFIAGLGLGGLAFALAAKDAVANIFGGIVIILEKPFSIGDWIYTPSVEGTIEDINFRSTKIRTFAQALVTVPNSTLANEPITNWTRMGRRRITFNLGVTYTTPRQKLEICIKRIRTLLENHPDIHKQTIFVYFDKFNDWSLDIFLYFFTHTTNWGEFLKVKEDVLLQIMTILEEENVSVAFPSRTIYVENNLENPANTFSAAGDF